MSVSIRHRSHVHTRHHHLTQASAEATLRRTLGESACQGPRGDLISPSYLLEILADPRISKLTRDCANHLLGMPAYQQRLLLEQRINSVGQGQGHHVDSAYAAYSGRPEAALTNCSAHLQAAFSDEALLALDAGLGAALSSSLAAAHAGGPFGAAGCQGLDGGMSTQEAAQILKENYSKIAPKKCGGRKPLTRRRLQDLVASPFTSPVLKAACNKILYTPGAFSRIENAYADKGLLGPKKGISLGDLNTATAPGQLVVDGRNDGCYGAGPVRGLGGIGNGQMDPHTAVEVLKQNWSQVSPKKCGGRKPVTRQRLRDLVASPFTSPALKAACNSLLNTPGAFSAVGHAYNGERGLGGNDPNRLSMGDLNTFNSPGFPHGFFYPW